MRVVLYGGSGMVGQGVLRECLADPEVTEVLAVGRSPLVVRHPKIRELVLTDLRDYSKVGAELVGYDACFFCLGISSAGLSEAAYRAITYDLTLAAARALVKRSPQMAFFYVSGSGTDSSEHGRMMWARVKGKTENDLRALPFARTFMFRPGYIQPLDGITSRTKLYRALYLVAAPVYPLLRLVGGKYMTTTREVGRAMLKLAKGRQPSAIIESHEITALADTTPAAHHAPTPAPD